MTAPVHRPRPPPPSTAPPADPADATTRPKTRGPCPGSFPYVPYNLQHPRHTAVVFTAKHRRAVFWRASCCISAAIELGSTRRLEEILSLGIGLHAEHEAALSAELVFVEYQRNSLHFQEILGTRAPG